MKRKGMFIGVVILVALTSIIYAIAQDQLEILDFKTREVDQSSYGVKVAWLVRVQNNTDVAQKVYVYIDFLDEDGFKLEEAMTGVNIQPRTIIDVTDYGWISHKLYQQVHSIKARF
jgi:hypothetical protein